MSTERDAGGAAANEAFRRAFEATPGNHCLIDPQTFAVVAVSEGMLAAAKARREDVVGRSIVQVLVDASGDPESDAPSNLIAMIEKVKETLRPETGGVQRFPIRLPPELGGGVVERFWRPQYAPILDARRRLLFVLHSTVDVTSENLADDRWRRAERMLRIAGRIARTGGWMVTVKDRKVVFSDEVCAIHELPAGYAPGADEAIGFYAPEWRARVAKGMLDCSERGVPFDEELELVTAAGNRLWVRTIAEPVRGADGSVVEIHGALQDISDRKRSERSLRIGNRRFRQLADAMPQIVWTAKVDGTIDYANRVFFAYVGERSPDLPAERWLKTLHPDDVETSLAAWRRAIAGGTPLSVELRLRRGSDGEFRWHSVSASPIRDEEGVIRKWYGAGVDIHDTKLAQQQVERLAARLDRTLQSIGDGLYTLDRDWRFTFANARAEQLLRRRAADILGQRAWDVFGSPTAQALEPRLRAIAASGRPEQFELYAPVRKIWFDMNVFPSEDGVSIYFRDITQAKRAQAAVQESLDRFRIVARATADAVWDWNLVDDTIWWSEGLMTLFGHDPQKIEPTSVSWTSRIHPDDRRRVVDGIFAVIDGREENWSDEYRFARADGSHAHVLDRGSVIRDEGGVAVRMVGSIQDVTERRLFEERMRESQRLEAVGQLTGGVAHDFNNLLQIVLGGAEDLLDGLPEGPARESADMIRAAAERGADLVSRLLAFSRRQALDSRATDIAALLRGMHGMLRRTLGVNIEIEMRLPDVAPFATVDPPQLENAILNLCINARDAMPEGGRLTISARRRRLAPHRPGWRDDMVAGDYVEISVSDTGTGMPPHVVSRAFEPFFTTKPVGQGTGLGLSMVFGFIKQSNGHISIESAPGEGTTVSLCVPAPDLA